MSVVQLFHRTVNTQYSTGFAVYQRGCIDRYEDVISLNRVMMTRRVSVKASCINRLHISDIVMIIRELQESSPDRHCKLLILYTDRGEVRQIAHFKIQFPDGPVHLVKHTGESPV